MVKANINSNLENKHIVLDGNFYQNYTEINFLIIALIKKYPNMIKHIKTSIETIDKAISLNIDYDELINLYYEGFLEADNIFKKFGGKEYKNDKK